MKTKLSRLFISTMALTLLLSFGATVRAQAPPPPPPPPALAYPPATPALLSQAYVALSAADRDYHGHRVHAMRLIEHAAKELGFTLTGGGHAREAQVTSDDQLRTAQGLLQQAATGLPPKAHEHVQKAIDELSIALSVK